MQATILKWQIYQRAPDAYTIPRMAFVFQNLFYFVLLLILLGVSGIFSGAETVLFSLSRHERRG